MRHKKRFSLIALLLVLLLLASCSGCPGQKTDESGSEAVPRESTEESVAESTAESLSETEPATSEEEPSKNTSETSESSEETSESETESESESDSDETDDTESESETSSEPTTEAPHVHTLEFTAGVYPSCTEPGHYEYYRCSGCGACFFDRNMQNPISSFDETVIPPTGHKLVHHPAEVHDCDKVGIIRDYYECENCGNWYLDEAAAEIVEDHASVISAGSHQLSHVAGVEASCRNFGVKEHWKCAICFRRFYDEKAEQQVSDPEKDLVIEELPHELEKVEAADASCSSDGAKTAYYQCKVCGSLFYDEKAEQPAESRDLVIPATGAHELEKVDKKEATATEDGTKEHYRCKVCGQLFLDEKGEKPVKSEDELVIPKTDAGESEETSSES